ncbi:hypothetical protein N2152v2_001965 [Parachlorella kessleri]
MGVVAYFSACWHALAACLCGPDKSAAADAAHERLSISHSAKAPLLGPAAANGTVAVQQQQRSSSRGSKTAVVPSPQPRMTRKSYGLNGLEKRLERRFSGLRVRAARGTDNLLGHGHRDVSADYQLGQLLGQGAFGVVRLATHRQTKERYACKTILKSQLKRPVEVEDVKREVAILELLSSHPNVAALLACYEDESSVNLILELCEGGELFERIATRGSLTEREAARYFRSMAEVVRHCHALGIMHRDIKPENFLLSDKSDGAVVRAADFGLSQFFRPGKRFRSLVGSAFYVAPEVLQRDYGPAADIWSLGVCLYILLSGLTPFWGESEEDIFRMVLHAEVDFDTPPWPHVSRAAKDLVRCMLQRNPDKRPTAAEIHKHPWLQRAAPDVQLDGVVIARMRNFAALNKVKRAAMLVAVQGLTQEDIPEVHALFESLDVDHSGRLSPQELWLGMQRLGNNMSQEDLTALMEGADLDGDGEIDYAEFVAATLGQSYAGRSEFVRRLFTRLDADNSGYVSAEELRALLGGYGVTGSEVDVVVRQADTDGDNLISFQASACWLHAGDWRVKEFVAFMSSNTESIQEAVRRKWSMSRHCSPRAAKGGAGQRATPVGGSPQAPFGSISEVDYEANGVGEAHVEAGTGSGSCAS